VGEAKKRAHLGVTAWARREERAFAHPTKAPDMIRNSKSLYSVLRSIDPKNLIFVALPYFGTAKHCEPGMRAGDGF
jgi:hypothetical protein